MNSADEILASVRVVDIMTRSRNRYPGRLQRFNGKKMQDGNSVENDYNSCLTAGAARSPLVVASRANGCQICKHLLQEAEKAQADGEDERAVFLISVVQEVLTAAYVLSMH